MSWIKNPNCVDGSTKEGQVCFQLKSEKNGGSKLINLNKLWRVERTPQSKLFQSVKFRFCLLWRIWQTKMNMVYQVGHKCLWRANNWSIFKQKMTRKKNAHHVILSAHFICSFTGVPDKRTFWPLLFDKKNLPCKLFETFYKLLV